MKNILKIEGIKALSKKAQKELSGGFLTEYIDSCHPAYEGLACLTGTPHCPTGFCVGFVCSPTATT